MKQIGIGLCLIGVGLILADGIVLYHIVKERPKKIRTDGAPGDYSFEDNWDDMLED